MANTHFVFAVALQDSGLLEEVLGETVVDYAWEQLLQRIEPQLNALFVRYSHVTDLERIDYACYLFASIDAHDAMFDLDEQRSVLFENTQRVLRESLVEYFGGGSGRKIHFSMLFDAVPDPQHVAPEHIPAWLAERGTTDVMLIEQGDQLSSPFADITKSEFVALLEQQQLQTFAQSIVKLDDLSVVGYEVLTRGPSGSEVERADKLFGSASHFGLTNEIELACVKQALTHVAELPEPLFMTINIGPEILTSDALMALLNAEHVKPFYHQLAFELTEHLPLADLDGVIASVKRLQDMGIQVCLDDTGCGFFDITTAEVLHPSIVKLCISVIRRIDASDTVTQEIVQTRERLDNLNALTLGEGVEEPFQVEALQRAGVHLAQGYYFDKPKPIGQALSQANDDLPLC